MIKQTPIFYARVPFLLGNEPEFFVETAAVSAFFRTFIYGDHRGSTEAFDYLPAVYGVAPAGGVLYNAVHAVGLTVMSRETNDAFMLDRSWKVYAQSVEKMRTALRDSSRAKSDEVLMSVILLALFEAATCTAPQSLRTWQAHLDGAKAIMLLRGPGQLETTVGKSMFIRLFFQIVR